MIDVQRIAIDKIHFPAESDAERKPPEEGSNRWPAFLELEADIGFRGLSSLYKVRPLPDGENYEVVDGTRRHLAVSRLYSMGRAHESFADGLISVMVQPMDESQALMEQVAANWNREKPLAKDQRRAIERVLNQKEMTRKEVAKAFGIGESYLNQLLNLRFLSEEIQKLLDNGTIGVTNAIQLAKLPVSVIEESEGTEEDWVKKAGTMTNANFITEVSKTLNELKKLRSTKSGEKKEFSPKATFMTKKEIEGLFETQQAIVEGMVADAEANGEDVTSNPEYSIALAKLEVFEVIFHLDAKSVQEQKEKYEKKKAEMEAKKEEKKKAREQAKFAEYEEHLAKQGKKIVEA